MRLQLDSALTGAGISGAGEAGRATPASGPAADQRVAGGSTGADSIQISGPSSALSRLSADRAERVQQLTALVQGGAYQVSSARVGGAIVDQAVS